MFENLQRKSVIQVREKNYFKFNFKSHNFRKLCPLPKVHEDLSDNPQHPDISNSGIPTEKVSDFLDHHLQPLMKQENLYIKDAGSFLKKLRAIAEVPKEAF